MDYKNKLNVLTKLDNARDYIKGLDIVKDGKNNFSKYSYFTPELVASLVHQACKEVGLTSLFSLLADENGLYGELTVLDISTGEDLVFSSRTAIPSIKATNEVQQLGGSLTYTQRYLKMSVFDIIDNAMDFDSKDQTKKVRPKLTKGSEAYSKAVSYIKEGGNIKAIQSKYIVEDVDGLMEDVKK